MPDTGYYVSGTCGCGCDRNQPCFYHGCSSCYETRASANAQGYASGHAPKCPRAPKLEMETL